MARLVKRDRAGGSDFQGRADKLHEDVSHDSVGDRENASSTVSTSSQAKISLSTTARVTNGQRSRSLPQKSVVGSSKLANAHSRPNRYETPPSLTQEERHVFENDPELFGVYAESDEESRPSETTRRGDDGAETPEISSTESEDLGKDDPASIRIESSISRLARLPHDLETEIQQDLPRERPLTATQTAKDPLGSPQFGSKKTNKSPLVAEPMNQFVVTKSGRYLCPLADKFDCEQTFADKKGAKRHAAKHRNVVKVTCDVCGEGFHRGDYLVRHMKNKHVDKKMDDSEDVSKSAELILQDPATGGARKTGQIENVRDLLGEYDGAATDQLTVEKGRGDQSVGSTAGEEPSANRFPKVFGQQSFKKRKLKVGSEAQKSKKLRLSLPIQAGKPARPALVDQNMEESGSAKLTPSPTSSSIGDNDDAGTNAKSSESSSRRSKPTGKPKLNEKGTLDGYVAKSAKAMSRNVDSNSAPHVVVNVSSRLGQHSQITSSARESTSRKGKERADSFTVQSPVAGNRQQEASDAEDESSGKSSKPKKARVSASKNKLKSDILKVKDLDEDSDAKIQRKGETSRSRVSASDKSGKDGSMGRTGRFDQEEEAALMTWRETFCTIHDIDEHEFNEMMTTAGKRGPDFPWTWNSITRAEFLEEYYNQLPDRNRRSMIRFRERNFQNANKDSWRSEDDAELRRLVRKFGPKWVQIGQEMERTQDEVFRRWKHKLNYGRGSHKGDWSIEETKSLEDAVQAFADKKGRSTDDDDLNIPWNAIAQQIGTGRSAQQCSNKWRISTHTRSRGVFRKIPHSDRIPGHVRRSNEDTPARTPSKMADRLSGRKSVQSSNKRKYKSKETITNSDDESSEEVQGDADPINHRQRTLDIVDDQDLGADETDNIDKDSEVGIAESDEDVAEEVGHRHPPDEEMQDVEDIDGSFHKSLATRPATSTLKQGEQRSNENLAEVGPTGEDTNESDAEDISSRSDRAESFETQGTRLPQMKSQIPHSPQIPANSNSPKQNRSRNPFMTTTPDPTAISLTQTMAATQANTTSKKTDKKSSQIVPETLERPSPSIRRQSQSSPLAEMIANRPSSTTEASNEREVISAEDANWNSAQPVLESLSGFAESEEEISGSDVESDPDFASASSQTEESDDEQDDESMASSSSSASTSAQLSLSRAHHSQSQSQAKKQAAVEEIASDDEEEAEETTTHSNPRVLESRHQRSQKEPPSSFLANINKVVQNVRSTMFGSQPAPASTPKADGSEIKGTDGEKRSPFGTTPASQQQSRARKEMDWQSMLRGTVTAEDEDTESSSD